MGSTRSILKKLQRSLDHDLNRWSLDDVADELAEGRARAFFGRDSVILVQEQNHPQGQRELLLWHAAGSLAGLEELYPQVEEWARGQKYDRINAHGRHGWLKFLPERLGYTPHQIVFVKDL